MHLIAVWDDTRGYGVCRQCGDRVTWFTTTDGRRLMFNLDPVALKMDADPGTWRSIAKLDPDDVHGCRR